MSHNHIYAYLHIWDQEKFHKMLLYIKGGVTVRFVRFCFFLVPDWIFGQNGQSGQSGQNGHKPGINASHELKFSR